MSKIHKIWAYYLGIMAECFAWCVLRIKGYHIIARRFKSKLGEVDLIALDGLTLVFIEIKYRKKFTDALEGLPYHQQLRIFHASQDFLRRNPRLWNRNFRYDFFAIGSFSFSHIENAWQIEEFVS